MNRTHGTTTDEGTDEGNVVTSIPVADLAELCRKAGERLTIQKRVVYEAVVALGHPTADDVLVSVQQRYSNIGKATVYRVLEGLVGIGALHHLSHDGRSKRYDAHTDVHHHLVCNQCGAISDWSTQYDLLLQDVRDTGFRIASWQMEIRGLCPQCAANKRN